ncbi:MAG: metallophosphoesterase [Methanoregulaceae archaeon]|nr:metallophosphoesterase [Methanoregulaceae archaeon]
MILEFLSQGPALLLKDEKKVLAVADLHLGIESELDRHGLHFRSRTRERGERVEACIRETGPDLLILLGDLKHGIPFTSRQELREIPEFIDRLRSLVPLCLVPGNHDVGIQQFFHPDEMGAKEGVVIDGAGYVHGHMYPDKSLAGKLIIAGHHHPMVCLRDEVGCALRSPAYLFSPLSEECLGFPLVRGEQERSRVIFMPSFNELTGYDLLRTVKEPFSPLSRCIKAGEAEVLLPDGTFLGPLQALEGYGADQES